MAERRKRKHKKSSVWKKILVIVFSVVLILVIAGGIVFAKLYHDVAKSADATYAKVERTKTSAGRESDVDLSKKEPFSVLLLGVDTGALGRTYKGRSDSMMVATVNPNDNKTTLVSLERDTYATIVGHGSEDKINHAYAFGGAGMSMDTVSNLLDIPIDHYIVINMEGIQQLVDAVGGVDVNNSLKFDYSQDGKTYNYDIGKIHLEGMKALGYLRMRYDDPEGDYGRQRRQREVVTAIAKKVLSLDGVTQYKALLDAMEDNVLTDLTFNQMKQIALDYRDAFKTIDTQQLKGTGFMQDGVSYQRVSEEDLKAMQDQLKTELEINQ
ncbi:LCP family glycopolymer transferase [Enterococcus italicus]|uniref:LCP family glycopolymer transferase n=1 Tax=Enterococcus italicus TaxID=246144 RepID=UPI003F48CDC8